MNLITITIDAGKLDRVRRCLSNCARYFQQEDMLLTAKDCAHSVAMLDDATKRQQAAMDERLTPSETRAIIKWHEQAVKFCTMQDDFNGAEQHRQRAIQLQSRASLGHELTGVGE